MPRHRRACTQIAKDGCRYFVYLFVLHSSALEQNCHADWTFDPQAVRWTPAGPRLQLDLRVVGVTLPVVIATEGCRSLLFSCLNQRCCKVIGPNESMSDPSRSAFTACAG